VDQSLRRAHGFDGEAVVIAWDWLPQIRVRLGGKLDRRVRFAYLLTGDELQALRDRGTRLFDMSGAEEANELANRVSLRQFGSTPLDSLR
jgi:hypothetical protein